MGDLKENKKGEEDDWRRKLRKRVEGRLCVFVDVCAGGGCLQE